MVERERDSEAERGGRSKRGEGESVNSYFLIKQQCSQLIHLICQLEENMAETSSPERGWEEGIQTDSYMGRKARRRRQKREGQQ